MHANIPLDSVLDALRECDDVEVVRDTFTWRTGILHEICRIVTHAHASGLAHPDLSTRQIFVDGRESVRVTGWAATRAADAIEADVRALGAIAHELLTLEPDQAPDVEKPRVTALNPLLCESSVFVLAAAVTSVSAMLQASVVGVTAAAIVVFAVRRWIDV